MVSGKLKNLMTIVGSMIIGAVVAVTGYHYGFVSSAEHSAHQHATTAQQITTERKVLFWYDPMFPATRFDAPGPSPFMDMDLVPRYAEEDDDSGESRPGIRIDPAQTQNLGLKTEQVRRGRLNYSLSVPANLSFNEYQFHIVQARADGFVNNVYPLTVGDKVTAGTPLIDVTIPEWVEAQSDYLILLSLRAPRSQLDGAIERLSLAGMSESDISTLTQKRVVQTSFQIKAPIDGVITAFDLRASMNVSKDNVIAQIQGIDPIWLNASLPESVAYLLKDSPQFQISLPAYPELNIKAEKWNLLPNVDPVTRTLQVRLQLANQDERLKPGMNAYLTLNSQSDEMLLIPSQAVIDTGDEQRVITLDENGRFVPKRITVFHQSQQQTAILTGLTENETVVTSGLFLIDSEANIMGALERMRQYDNVDINISTESDSHNHSHVGH